MNQACSRSFSARRAVLFRIDPRDTDFSARRNQKRCQHLDRGGFACAVRADESEDFTFLHAQIQIITAKLP